MAKSDPLSVLTVKEVADRLRCSEATVMRRIYAGKLRAMIDGRLIRVTPEDLATFIRNSRRWR